MDKVQKIKCNYHLAPNTKQAIDQLHTQTGMSRGLILDILVKHYGTEILNIFMKGETQPVVCASTYTE